MMAAVRNPQSQDLPTHPHSVEPAVPEQLCFSPLPRVQDIDRESFQRHYLGLLSPTDRLMNRLLGARWFAWKDRRTHASDQRARGSAQAH